MTNLLLTNGLLWDFGKLHAKLLRCIDESYKELFSDDKKVYSWNGTWDKKRISVSQTCLLGTGGGDDHKKGGLWSFAEEYVKEILVKGIDDLGKNEIETISKDIRGYTRYNDFQLYTFINYHLNRYFKKPKVKGSPKQPPWYKGEKRLLLVVEAENNPDELKGEFVGLLQVRCPFKYLFIKNNDKNNILEEINKLCQDPDSCINEIPETHLCISEIPTEQVPPLDWNYYHAYVENDGKIKFDIYK
jgi:hypothetical protein